MHSGKELILALAAVAAVELLLRILVAAALWPTRAWVALNLILALILGPYFYVRSADRAYAAGRSAHRAADCTRAIDRYRHVRDSYSHRFAPVAGKARAGMAECEQFLRADRARSSKAFSVAVDQYRSFEKAYPHGLLRPVVHAHAADAYRAWAQELAGQQRYVDAVRTYQVILVVYRDTKAAATAGPAIDATYRTAVARYVRHDYCGALSVLTEFANAPSMIAPPAKRTVTSARQSLPQALYECGVSSLNKRLYVTAMQILERLTGEYPRSVYARLAAVPMARALFGQAALSLREHHDETALSYLDRLVRGYPRSAVAGQARAMIASANARIAARQAAAREQAKADEIRRTIEQLAHGQTNQLPPPVRAGSSGSGKVSLALLNGSPKTVRILMGGPKAYAVTIPACGGCGTSFSTLISPCQSPGRLPSKSLTVAPGDYRVAVVAVRDPTVRPFIGRWGLSGGARYRDCFYIVKMP